MREQQESKPQRESSQWVPQDDPPLSDTGDLDEAEPEHQENVQTGVSWVEEAIEGKQLPRAPYTEPYHLLSIDPEPPRQPRSPWIAVAIVALVILGAGVLIASLLWANTQRELSNTGSNTPVPAQHHYQVGKTASIAHGWTVTISNAGHNQGVGYQRPASDKIFLVLDVEMKNISTSTQTASSMLMFTLKDSEGQQYYPISTIFASRFPDGNVEAGRSIKGQLVYEVAASMHQFTLTFQQNLTPSELAIWDISV